MKWLLLTLCVLLGLVPQILFAQETSAVRLTGGVGVVYRCADEEIAPDIWLTTATRQNVLLELSPELIRSMGGYRGLSGKWLNVEGTWTSDAKHLRVTHLASPREEDIPASFRNSRSSGLVETMLDGGPKAYVTILAKFKNIATVPHPKSWYQALLYSGTPGLNPYFTEQSYGNINLNGSTVVDWVTLPKNSSDYERPTGIKVDDEAVVMDAIAAVKDTVDFRKYYGINVIVNSSIGAIGGTGGTRTYTLNGVTRIWGRTYDNSGDGMFGLLAHEMGHSLGFDHSSGPYNTPYDSNWDQMSAGSNWNYRGTYGPYPVHTNAYHRDVVGWIPRSRILFGLPGTDQTIRLERLVQPSSSGYLMARIFLGGSATHYLTVEARKYVGTYEHEVSLPGQAVVLHDVDELRITPDPFGGPPSNGRRSQVVDATADSNPNDAGSMWIAGETYKDAANGVTIDVLSSEATSFTVRIRVAASAKWPNVVRNTSDSDGGSLRSAIVYSNLFPGTTVKFSVPSNDPNVVSGIPTISPITPFPAVTASGVIDASAQPGTGITRVMVDGSRVGTWGDGLQIRGKDIRVKGLAFGNFPWAGISVLGGSGAMIENCAVGTDASGTVAKPNNAGLDIRGAAIGGVVKNSTLSGNKWAGAYLLEAGTENWTFTGNRIGTNSAGTKPIPNTSPGIYIAGGAKGIKIGGLAVTDRNIISGNGWAGIGLTDAGTANVTIIGNYIGTDVTGKLPLGNVGGGVVVQNGVDSFRIGGATAAERNVISDNQQGIGIYSKSTNGIVEGNYVGLSATGTAALGTQDAGVAVGGASTGVTIRGNVISGNLHNGVSVFDAGTNGTQVVSNLLGLNAAGTAAVPNAFAGVSISGGASLTKILNNTVSGNKGSGIQLNKAPNTIIRGNRVGLNLAGTVGIPNLGSGIWLGEGSARCTVGGLTAADRNIVGANNGTGIALYSVGTDYNVVQGNWIGFAANGITKQGVKNDGIYVAAGAKNNVIGGTDVGAGNVIGFGGGSGIGIWNAGTSGNKVLGNLIGFDTSGGRAAGNKYSGITIGDSASSNVIGGAAVGAPNRIGWNDGGISLFGKAKSNIVQGNQIGIASDDKTLAPNGWGGIRVGDGSTLNQVLSNRVVGYTGCGISITDAGTTGNLVHMNTVGGSTALKVQNTGWAAIGLWNNSSGNKIGDLNKGNLLFGGNYGIYVNDVDTVGNTFRANRILQVAFMAIDLGGDGRNINDELDADTGPNNRQNAPTMEVVSRSGANVKIRVYVMGRPNAKYRFEIFSGPTLDAKGNAVPDKYITFVEVTANAFGIADSTLTVSTGSAILSSTATDLATGDTGELSLPAG